MIVSGALSEREGGKALAAELEDRFTVYRYDRRGRGESGDTKPYAVDREIEDLGAVIEQAGNEAFVYGVSSGAALALRAAPKLGAARVPKLAVYEAPYGQETRVFEEQVPDTVAQISVPTLVMTGEKGMGFMHQTADSIAKLVPNAERKTIEGQTHQAVPEVMARLLTEFFAPEK